MSPMGHTWSYSELELSAASLVRTAVAKLGVGCGLNLRFNKTQTKMGRASVHGVWMCFYVHIVASALALCTVCMCMCLQVGACVYVSVCLSLTSGTWWVSGVTVKTGHQRFLWFFLFPEEKAGLLTRYRGVMNVPQGLIRAFQDGLRLEKKYLEISNWAAIGKHRTCTSLKNWIQIHVSKIAELIAASNCL